MNTTVRMKAADIAKDWHVIDADGRPLGRVATEAATLLMGKHKPTWEPHLDDGDFVIVVNASKLILTGRKTEQVKYHRHSGYPGGLRTRTFTEQFSRFPDRVVEEAVWGMLPDGPLGKAMLKHLKVYRGPDHPHQSQVVGSERARAAREAARAETLTVERKPRRLRPLGGVTSPLPIDEIAPVIPASAPEAPMVPPVLEAPDEAPAEAVLQAAGPVDEPEVEVVAEAEAKPRRRRAAAAGESPETPSAEAASPAVEPEKRPRRRTARTEE